MKSEIKCVVDNTVKTWSKNGLLHRADGPAVIKCSGENRVEEYWFEGCLVSAAMLEFHKTLTAEIDELLKNRKVVHLESLRFM